MPQKNWDKYEVALLIEVYQNIKQGRVDKSAALVALSHNLRQMAKNEGLEIDDTFRNLNGMQWQLGFIERAFISEDYESRTPPRTFIEMVAIYNENQIKFQSILAEAHSKIKGKKNLTGDERKQFFIKWLCSNTNFLSNGVVRNIEFISDYVRKRKVAKKCLWDIGDYKELNIVRVKISGNKLFKLMHGKEHRQFEKYGKLYSDFLKECSEKDKNIIRAVEEPTIESATEKEIAICTQESLAITEDMVATETLVGTSVIYEYVKWLVEVRFMSENTSRGYGSTLRVANIKAQEMGLLDGSLFNVGDENLKEIIGNILSDSDFSEYNAQQHNRFSAALNAYLMFKTGERVSGIRVRKHNKPQKVVICPDDLKTLLLKKFPYGIRIDSEINMIKLKNFAEMFEVGLADNEELLKAQISAGGISFEGKIYFVSEDVYNGIVQKINDIFSKGFSVVYYEELLSRNFDWFDENHISSWELLREILDKRSDNLFIGKNFLWQGNVRINEADAVEKELVSVWGKEVIHTYDEIYSRLPYIPDEKIKFYLSYCKKFVWSTHETFARIDKVVISEEEKQVIIDYVESECELKGHSSIANVPLGNIEEENYQISITAIYDAVYRLVLSDKFSLNGKILTKSGVAIDALTLAKTYCTDKEECAFEKLNGYVISINGMENRQITFRAAYDQMTRISEEMFVADYKVHFDVDAIDMLLEQMIKDDFVSIKTIATFIMFPNCGYTWTHYLLESFCYRFSKKFRLDVINFNDKNVGIIVKKGVNLLYIDMLAIVVANSDLDLRADIIGQYLFENGYMARRKAPIIDSAIEQAKFIRESR